MTRPSTAEQTKRAILGVARKLFAETGFDRTTIRAVAAAADVDPALVMHYFGTKQNLFVEAVRLELVIPDLSGTAPEQVAGVLVPYFLQVWRDEGQFLGLLRAAATHRSAAEALIELFSRQVAPTLLAVTPDHVETRAALIGSQLIGIAVSRTILEAPPLLALSVDQLVAWLSPVVAHYLTAPLPEVGVGSPSG